MRQLLIQIVRTVVPFVIGWLITQLARVGILLPEGAGDQLIADLTAWLPLAFGALYYAAVAWLERRYKWFGWLLGIARRPDYEKGRHSA